MMVDDDYICFKGLLAFSKIETIFNIRTAGSKANIAFGTDLPPGFLTEGKIYFTAGTGLAPGEPLPLRQPAPLLPFCSKGLLDRAAPGFGSGKGTGSCSTPLITATCRSVSITLCRKGTSLLISCSWRLMVLVETITLSPQGMSRSSPEPDTPVTCRFPFRLQSAQPFPPKGPGYCFGHQKLSGRSS